MTMRFRTAALATTLVLTIAVVATVAQASPWRDSSPAPAAQAESPWSTRAPLPATNSEIAVAELDRKIYVIGGYPSTRAVQRTVQVYDSVHDTWEVTTPLPVPLHHTVAASLNGKLYVLGGELANANATASGPSFFTNAVLEYDPATAAWSPRAPMPTARSGGAAAVVGNKIYVAGGRPPRGADFAVYDTASDTWEVLPDLPTQRNHLAATAIDGLVYVAGGRFGGGVGSEMTAALEVFDPATGVWSARAPLPAPRAGLNGIAAQGCFYTFGGEGNDSHRLGIFEQMERYDPTTDTWQTLEPLPIPVHGVTGSAFLNGWIHLPGGGTERGGNSGSTHHQIYHVTHSCGSRA